MSNETVNTPEGGDGSDCVSRLVREINKLGWMDVVEGQKIPGHVMLSAFSDGANECVVIAKQWDEWPEIAGWKKWFPLPSL